MNHLSEEDLILLYYNEPAAPRGHLADCPACREALAALSRTLDVCNSWDPPEPDPAFLANLNRTRTIPGLDRRGGVPRYAWLAAAAALILSIAFFAGRASRPPEPIVLSGLSQQARERILAISLADHLDRAELLLTEIANTSDSTAAPDRARDLVSEGRLLRQSASGSTGDLLDEVERFMLEVSNSPDSAARWRDRIHSQSLLFKVRILQSNLRQKEEKL